MKKLLTISALLLVAIAFTSCETDETQPVTYPDEKHPWGPQPAGIIGALFVEENADQPYTNQFGVDTVIKATYIAINTETERWHDNTGTLDGRDYGITYYMPLDYQDSLTVGDTFNPYYYFQFQDLIGGYFYRTDPVSGPIWKVDSAGVYHEPADWLYHN